MSQERQAYSAGTLVSTRDFSNEHDPRGERIFRDTRVKACAVSSMPTGWWETAIQLRMRQ